jgi:hypothetical protein
MMALVMDAAKQSCMCHQEQQRYVHATSHVHCTLCTALSWQAASHLAFAAAMLAMPLWRSPGGRPHLRWQG